MTMLRNLDDEVAVVSTTSTATAITVEEHVEVVHRPSEARTFLDKDVENWGWEELRDYVVHEIEQRFGPFPRDSKKEVGIFKAFLSRHGAKAGLIARHAFEVSDGRWSGAPVSINRFCRNSDPYFAEVILARLVTEPVQGWT